MSTPVKVLIIEDSEDDAKLALRALRTGGFDPTHRRVQTAADLTNALTQEGWDAVISDFNMPGFTGMDALRIFRSNVLDIPFILVSGTIGEGIAVDAMKAGASDYVMKNNLARLAPALERELKETQMRAAHHQAQRDLIESEARFRSLTEMSSDFYWESDTEHRLTTRVSANTKPSMVSEFQRGVQIGERRWEIPHLSPDEAGWQVHRAVLDAHLPFRDFEFSRLGAGGEERHISISGDPVFDAQGAFKGYRGVGTDITERKRVEEEIRSLAKFPEENPNAILRIGRNGAILYANQSSAPILTTWGREAGQNVPDDWQKWIAETLKSGISKEVEIECNRRIISCSLAPILAEEYVNIYGRDITERKEAENRIRRLNRIYAVLSGINTLIVRVHDRDKLFNEACHIAVEHGQFRMAWIGVVDPSAMKVELIASVGVEPEFLTIIKSCFSLREDASPANTLVARAIAGKKAVVSNDVQNDPALLFGKRHFEHGTRSLVILPLLIADEAVGVLALFAREAGFFDAEEMKLLTELASDIAFAMDHLDKLARLDYLAYYDVLTGLANRSLFLERVAQYLRSAVGGGHKLAVALIDLERFKNINDSLGRPAGDALLKQVAEWLTRITGDPNMLARVGADHFAGVLPQVKQGGDVARLLEKTMEAFLEHPFRLNDAVFRVAAKVGVAVFPEDGADAETLFRNAEAALKKAKASGQRYLFYTQTMTDAVAGKLSLENQLRQAIDNEEFVLHYQPKVNLASGKLTSAEALIRWNDPRTGLVPPGRFIPILEETGMIYDVGRWALKKAIEDYLRWRAEGLAAVRIAVNVSALQLRHRGFIEEIRQAIGIDAQAATGLEIEITESLIMEDVKGTIASLQAIRDLGVTIAIDDFGTGFSSLAYLAKLPVDTLKIDRSFVNEMTVAPEGLALVSAIISLAHSLKLKVVAEGVETEEQSRLLRLLACDEMQGFLFSKPVPVEIFETRFLAPPRAA